MRRDAKDLVRAFIARINTHDPSAIVAMCTSDHVFTDSLGASFSGQKKLEQGWNGYFALFPDYRIELDDIASVQNVVLACGVAAGTHAASGAAWRIPAAWRAVVVDGKLAEWQVYADNKPVYEILSRRA